MTGIGKIAKTTPGALNTEVIIELPRRMTIVSIINKSSAERMKLKESKEVAAIAKTSNVIIVTNMIIKFHSDLHF